MIIDRLHNYLAYVGANPDYEKAFGFIKNFQSKTPDGQYAIDGDRIFAMVQSYRTGPAAAKQWEAHRKYIDLQYVIAGKEKIAWININQLKPCTEYDPANDCILLEGPEGTAVEMGAGFFMILLPEDAHKPGCDWNGTEPVRKIVVKIRI